jgi:cytochrome c oxidase cbb3-type subunit 3
MRYILIGGFTIIVTLLVSKVYTAISLIHFNKYPNSVKTNTKTSKHKQLLETGKSVYMVYCTSCHGQDGKGNNGKAHDHTKRIVEKSVLDVIENGSNNFTSTYRFGMPSHLVEEQDAKQIAKYVANGLKGNQPKSWEKCATCHAQDGTGINYIAPNIKTYSDELVTTVLLNGKKGVIGTMPSFKGRLTDYQIKSVATYIRSLGN